MGNIFALTFGAKTFRTFIRIYSRLKIERLGANIKLTLRKALIRSVMSYVCPSWELVAQNCSAYKARFFVLLEIFQGSQRSAICTRLSTFLITKHNKIVQATSRNHAKS
jgi:hypothetical protein